MKKLISLAFSALVIASSYSLAGPEDCASGEKWRADLGCYTPAVGSTRG